MVTTNRFTPPTTLPPAVAFPAPTGGFPQPASVTDPSFGVNPFSPGNMYLGSAFQQNTQSILTDRATKQAQLMQAAQFAATNAQVGNALDSNPQTWTPESAAQQTDRALAKLSTVNPQLAETLAAQRTGQPPQDGGGFFHDLVHTIGTVLHPGLEMFGKALDLVGRTAHIVPNIAFDAADGGGFNIANDVGGALTGSVAHNWHSVIDQVTGGHSGILGAVLGGIGDIATDPLTWIIPVGAGAKIGEVAEQGARIAGAEGLAKVVAGKSAEELNAIKPGLGAVAKFVEGQSAEQVAEVISQHAQSITEKLGAVGARAGIVSPDLEERGLAMANGVYKDGERELYSQFWEINDRVDRMIRSRTLRTVARDGIALSDGELVSARDAKSIFEKAIKNGAWKANDSAEWRLARNLTGAAGGMRFKVAVPFTQFRYISSPVADLTRFMPHAAGSVAARFFSGQSGMNNLIHEITRNGAPETMLRDWMELGYKGISEVPEYQQVLARMRGRGHNLGGMLYQASERLGGITANFDKMAGAARHGFVGQHFGYKTALEADNAKRDFIRNLMRRTAGEDQNIHEMFTKAFGISQDARLHTASDELQSMVRQHLSIFPAGVDTSTDGAVEQWFRASHPEFEALDAKASAQGAVGSRGEAVSELTPDEFDAWNRLDRNLKEAKQVAHGPVETGWNQEQLQAMDVYRARHNVAKDVAAQWEGGIGHVGYELDSQLGINPEQIDLWRSGEGVNHPFVRGEGDGTYYLHSEDAAAHREALNRGVGENHMVHGDSHGVKVSTKRMSPDDIPVIIKGKDFIELDAAGNGKLPNGLIGGTEDRTVADVAKVNHEALTQMQQNVGLDMENLAPDEIEALRRKEVEMMTETMKAARPNAAGTVRRFEDGHLEATVWDTNKVKRFGDEWQVATANQGYYPRYINDAASKWVNGVIDKESTQPLLREPFIRAEIERKTNGMTLTEAQAYVRDYLQEKFPHANIDSLPKDLFELNPLTADVRYLDGLANDISARVFGDASERLARLGRLAPHIFPAVPRDQQFEWNVSKGYMRMLSKTDRKLAGNILRLKKREAAYLDQWHKVMGRQADGFGHFATLMDQAEAGHIGLPDAEMTAVLKHAETKAKAQETIDGSLAVITGRRAEIDQEAARYAGAREEFVTKASEGSPVPVAPAADEAAAAGTKPRSEMTAAEILAADNAAPSADLLAREGGVYAQAAQEADLAKLKSAQKEFDDATRVADEQLAKYGKVSGKNVDRVNAANDALDAETKRLGFAGRSDAEIRAAGTADLRPKAATDKAVAAYRDAMEYQHYYTHPEFSGQGKADLTKAAAYKAKADKIFGTLPPETQHVLNAEDAVRETQTARNAAQEAFDNLSDAATTKQEQAAGKKVEAAEYDYASAKEELNKAKQIAEGGVDWAAQDAEKMRAQMEAAGVLPKSADAAEAAIPKSAIGGDESKYPKFSDLPPDEYLPAKVLPTGEKLPAVRLRDGKATNVGEKWDHAGRKIDASEVEYVKTRDLYDNVSNKVYRKDAEQLGAYKDYVATEGQTHPVEVIVNQDGTTEVLDGNHALEANWQLEPDGYTAVRRVKDDPRDVGVEMGRKKYDPVPAGETLHSHSPDHFRSPQRVAEQVFDREAEAGNLYHNANTGSLFTREGNLVAQGGGSRLRHETAREMELRDLADQERELTKAQDALAKGRRYDAPADVQAGAKDAEGNPIRKPGEQRTPAERAQFEVQTSQRGLERAGAAHDKTTVEAVQAGKTLGRLKANLNDTANAVNTAYAEAKGIRAELKPALIKIDTAGDLAGLTNLSVPGLEGYAMPSYVATEWHSVIQHQGPGALSSEWRKWVLGPWKRWATYRWPGFHVRNMYGAWFNNFLGGVTTHDYEFAWRVNNFGNKDWRDVPVSAAEFKKYNLARQFGADTEGQLTYGHLKEHLSHIGIGSANTQSVLGAADTIDEFQAAVDKMSHKAYSTARKGLNAVDGRMRDVGAGVEDYHRVAAWGAGMGNTGGDSLGARAFVMLRHGDYAELTQAEDHIRDLIPFYKWLRTNTPYQIRMLGENPGGTLLVASKLKSFAYDAQGIDQKQAELKQPTWMKESLTIPIPKWVPFIGSKGPDAIKYAMFDLPYKDLYNGLNDYLSAGLPVARNLIESYGIHESAFTGTALSGKMKKLSGAFGNPIMGELLSTVGMAKKGADGSYYIDDRFENVLTAIPIYSRFRNFAEADPSRVEQRMGGIFSMLAGVQVRPDAATQAELDFYQNEVAPVLQQYRDMGVTFPNAQDFARAGAAASPTGLPSLTPGTIAAVGMN